MRRLIAIALLWGAGISLAHAHLMVAQRGTLNFVENGVFMVLSLPVSALTGTDDDGDGKLSMTELQAHRDSIFAAVQANLKLSDASGARPLEGLMLSLSPPDSAPTAPAPQLIAMGRFALADKVAPLRFEVRWFGEDSSEQTFQIAVTRVSQKQLLILTPDAPEKALLPSAWLVFSDYVVLGAKHIFIGLDHLLFLLVVMSAARGWRSVLVALSTFTAGHAITLALTVWGGISAPAALVEPAIAATIVGVAAFDLHAQQRGKLPSPLLRMAMVFGCALIHGLGLASVFTELGLDSQLQVQSMTGFNMGVELGQLAVALAAAVVVACIHRVRGAGGVALTTKATSFVSIALGSFWLIQRGIMPS